MRKLEENSSLKRNWVGNERERDATCFFLPVALKLMTGWEGCGAFERHQVYLRCEVNFNAACGKKVLVCTLSLSLFYPLKCCHLFFF